MKFFRKKHTGESDSRPQAAKPDPERSFYTTHAGEAPLDEYFDAASFRQTHRTSRHSPSRRRENSNRASRWSVFLLLFRTALILLLLIGGFIVLKLGLSRMEAPSERKQQEWEAKAERMTKAPGAASVQAAAVQVPAVSPELISQRLEQWEQTGRYLRSAESLSRQGIDDEAIQRLQQALRVSPDNQAAQRMLLDIYMRRGLHAAAIPFCIRLLDQDSDQPELQMKLLQALQASGQTAAGLVLAEKMLEDQPNNLTMLSFTAAGRLALGNTNSALALFERMLENDDQNKDALKNCGNIYFEQGDYPKAAARYLELVRVDARPEHYQMLARCYARQNDPGKAVVFMGQAASLFGEATVSPWLRDTQLDTVRESVAFRSFADRIVGIETRKAIEAINRREAEKTAPQIPDGLDLPKPSDLNVIRPAK